MTKTRKPILRYDFEYPRFERLSTKTIAEIETLERIKRPLPHRVKFCDRPGKLRQFPNKQSECQIETQDPEYELEGDAPRTYRTPDWHIDSGGLDDFRVSILSSRFPALYAMGSLSICSAYIDEIVQQIVEKEPGLGHNFLWGVNGALEVLAREAGYTWVEDVVASGLPDINEHANLRYAGYTQAPNWTLQTGLLGKTLHKSAVVPEGQDFVNRLFFRSIKRIE